MRKIALLVITVVGVVTLIALAGVSPHGNPSCVDGSGSTARVFNCPEHL